MMSLSAQAIAGHMAGHPWADRITVLSTIDSTNRLAKELAAQGAPEGASVIADRQTAGRGRLGRGFSSPAGAGLYLSVVLRPSLELLMSLTCRVGVATCRALEQSCNCSPGIKWVNDLVLNRRKLAGILVEVGYAKEQPAYAVAGIGINCARAREDFPPELQATAGSILSETGIIPDRSLLAGLLLKQLAALPDAPWLEEYRRRCVTLGQQVQILRNGEALPARALDIDGQGRLLVAYPDGRREAIGSGEVSVRGMYGYV